MSTVYAALPTFVGFSAHVSPVTKRTPNPGTFVLGHVDASCPMIGEGVPAAADDQAWPCGQCIAVSANGFTVGFLPTPRAFGPATGGAATARSAAQADTAAEAWIKAYTGTSDFFLSLKKQARSGKTLSDKQVACIDREMGKTVRPPVVAVIVAGDPVTCPGMYRRNVDGVIFRVVLNQAGTGLYAKLSTSTGFQYESGAIKTLKASDRMSLEDVKDHGRETGTCCVCTRTLTNAKSIEAGIGPICSGNV